MPGGPQAGPRAESDAVVLPSAKLWRLGAHPEALNQSAQAWRELAGELDQAAGEFAGASAALLAEWSGEAASAYQAHQEYRGADLSEVSNAATTVGTTLDGAAAVLRRAQGQLTAAYARMLANLTTATVAHATDEAHAIRTAATTELAALTETLNTQRRRMWAPQVAADWSESQDMSWGPSDPELTGMSRVIEDGNRVVVSGTGSGDEIEVGRYADGQQFVRVNNVGYTFPAGKEIVVRAGGGADKVRVTSDRGVTVLGGDGKDEIDGGDGDDLILGLWDDDVIVAGGGSDTVFGGSDSDYISGGAGDDLLDGGSSADIVYGLDGNDSLWGSGGHDYLDGGGGADRVDGGRGDDTIMGGRGGDRLLGGFGNDTMASGEGTDTVSGGDGNDRAYLQPDDSALADDVVLAPLRDAGDITVDAESTMEFRARVRSDLDVLASVPAGSAMLDSLQASHARHGDSLVIEETAGQERETGEPRGNSPVGARIFYNPTYSAPGPNQLPNIPITHLFHEMGHAYDDMYDTAAIGRYYGDDDYGVNNLERAVIGLPIDHDNDPDTPNQLHPDHPYAITENALREQVGLPRRNRYHR